MIILTLLLVLTVTVATLAAATYSAYLSIRAWHGKPYTFKEAWPLVYHELQLLYLFALSVAVVTFIFTVNRL